MVFGVEEEDDEISKVYNKANAISTRMLPGLINGIPYNNQNKQLIIVKSKYSGLDSSTELFFITL